MAEIKYSTLDEKYPNSENPFDFRPPNILNIRILEDLSTYIVKGLKIETEQGVETVQKLLDRVYVVIRQMELQLEADPESEVQTLPECIRKDVRTLICTVRANMAQLKNIKEVDPFDPDFEPPTHSW